MQKTGWENYDEEYPPLSSGKSQRQYSGQGKYVQGAKGYPKLSYDGKEKFYRGKGQREQDNSMYQQEETYYQGNPNQREDQGDWGNKGANAVSQGTYSGWQEGGMSGFSWADRENQKGRDIGKGETMLGQQKGDKN